jgi:hypothetical protein
MQELERQYAGEFHGKLAEEKNLARVATKAKQNPAAAAGQALEMTKKMQPRELLKQVNLFSDIPFFLAMGAALFKDLLDYTGLGSLPGIGTVITFIASMLLLMALILSGSLKARRAMKKLVVMAAGTVVEAFGFGINFLPIETIAAAAVYLLELQDRAMQENN